MVRSTYLLDTNAWIFLFSSPDRISAATRRLLNDERSLAIASISFLEVVQAHVKGRLRLLPLDPVVWMKTALPAQRIERIELTPRIALAAYGFDDTFCR